MRRSAPLRRGPNFQQAPRVASKRRDNGPHVRAMGADGANARGAGKRAAGGSGPHAAGTAL